jgi:hypothetical protein
MSNTNTYDIVYDINLRHRIRHEHTNLRSRMLKVTYDIVCDLHLRKHTTSSDLRYRRLDLRCSKHIRHRRSNVVRNIARHGAISYVRLGCSLRRCRSNLPCRTSSGVLTPWMYSLILVSWVVCTNLLPNTYSVCTIPYDVQSIYSVILENVSTSQYVLFMYKIHNFILTCTLCTVCTFT